MSNSIFKSSVVFIVLIALGFVVGSMAADGLKQAAIPIALICCVFGVLLLGRHCWVLAFVLPPLFSSLEISLIQNFPVAYVVCAFLLVYWLLMWVMGYVKITWHRVWLLDIFTFIFVGYFLFTWVMHPVTLDVLVNEITHEGDAQIGGKEYVWCIACIFCYLFLSVLPLKYDGVVRLLKVAFWISLPMLLLSAVKVALLGAGLSGESTLSSAGTSRYMGMVGIGNALYTFILCKYGIMGIVCSPIKFLIMCGGGLCVALSGFRTHMMVCAFVYVVTQLLHRQLCVAMLPLVCGYVLMCYLAGNQYLSDLPFGVKRVLASIPGLDEIDRRVTLNAEGSLEWRYLLWDLAMNPSTGYIKDYVWGDGFGYSKAALKQAHLLYMRGKMIGDMDHLQYARQGMWHNGNITAIHRIGYVGYVMLIVWTLAVFFVIFRLLFCIRNTKNCEYVYYYTLSAFSSFLNFYASGGALPSIFNTFFSVSLAKLLYSLAMKAGYIAPMLRRKVYIPLMLREQEEGEKTSDELVMSKLSSESLIDAKIKA